MTLLKLSLNLSYMLYFNRYFLLFLAIGVAGFASANQSIQELEQFVVTGTRTERLVTEAPVKTELYTRDEIETFHFTSIREALTLVPAARFEADCQNCGLNQIQLLGLSTDYTSMLFDGAPLYSGVARIYGADLFPAIFIDRIEVVKGGSSVLYGPEAMAGVVNLITSEPIETKIETRLIAERIADEGTSTEASLRGDYVDPDGNFAITGYAYREDRDGIDLTTDGFSEIPEFENTILGAQFWYFAPNDGILRSSYQRIDQSHRGGDQLNLPFEQSRVTEALSHVIDLTNLTWSQRINGSLDYALRMSYIDITRDSFYGARGAAEVTAWEEAGFSGDPDAAWLEANSALVDSVGRRVVGLTENTVWFFDAQVNYGWEDHLFSIGAQHRDEELTEASPNDPTKATTFGSARNTGIFLQDQWQINSQLEFVPGIRLDDHSNIDDSIISPRIAARWEVNDHFSLRASYATGFNAPGPFNEDQHIGTNQGGAITLINSPDLEEERSATFSLGAEWHPEPLKEQLLLHSQVHFTALEGTFEIDDSDELNWLRINGPDSEVFVWENSLDWQVAKHLHAQAGLTYIRARFDEAIERVTGLTTDEYLERPEWTALLGLSYDNPELFDAFFLLNYTGEMLATGEDADIWRRTPNFWEVNLGVSKTWENVLGNGSNLRLSIGVDNLFDERQKDLQDNGEDRDVTYFYGPARPRSYYTSVTVGW